MVLAIEFNCRYCQNISHEGENCGRSITSFTLTDVDELSSIGYYCYCNLCEGEHMFYIEEVDEVEGLSFTISA